MLLGYMSGGKHVTGIHVWCTHVAEIPVMGTHVTGIHVTVIHVEGTCY